MKNARPMNYSSSEEGKFRSRAQLREIFGDLERGELCSCRCGRLRDSHGLGVGKEGGCCFGASLSSHHHRQQNSSVYG